MNDELLHHVIEPVYQLKDDFLYNVRVYLIVFEFYHIFKIIPVAVFHKNVESRVRLYSFSHLYDICAFDSILVLNLTCN